MVSTSSPEVALAANDAAALARSELLRRERARGFILGGTVLATVVFSLLALTAGSGDVGLGSVVRGIGTWAFGDAEARSAKDYTIVTELRLPRVVLALLVGAGLAIGGAALQGLLRNPLVSPFTLGISPAAAFGASFAIIMFSESAPGSVSWYTILGALVASGVVTVGVIALSSAPGTSIATIVLFGVALSAIFNALTALVQFVADDQTNARIVRWSFGTFNNASWSQVLVMAVLLAIALPVFLLRAKDLNALSFLGDEPAKSLGIRVARVRTTFIVLSVVLAAVAVSFCGIIGFVGLVGPHIARMLVGSDHRVLFPLSAVLGGLLLVAADWIGRIIAPPVIIPVGILVALIGAPIFVYLIFQQRKAGA